MRWGLKASVLALGSAVALGITPAGAQEDPGLKAEVELLRERLNKLEDKLASQQATESGAAEGSAIVQLPSGLNGVNMGGFVDTSYTYSFNEPESRTTGLRVFDTRAGDFMLNNVELYVEKPVSSESPVGFRTDLQFGQDAEVTGSVTTGLGSGTDEIDIQQGYVEYLAPVGTGLDVKAGKFTTLHGAEVTESKDNWNFSRSWLFGFAEPLTHTGIRAHYGLTDGVMLMAGVSNGWDVVDDNNKAKSVETGITLTPMEGVTLGSSYMIGAEQAGDSHDQRHFWSFVAGYDPMEQLHLKLALDYGYEQEVQAEDDGGNASWNGIAAYAKYDLTDKWSVASRFEVFNDQDMSRTGAAIPAAGISDLQLYGVTLTNEYKLHEHLIARLEYRYDKADGNVFGHDGEGLLDYQNTIAMEFIAPF
jgi:hypothetical protein